MSKARGVGPAPSRDIQEGFVDFLSGAARLLLYGGAALALVGVGFLIFTTSAFSGGAAPASEAQALSNIGIFDKILMAGVLGMGVGATYLFWGESILGALMLIGALLMYFAPMILTNVGIASSTGMGSRPVTEAMAAITRGGLILGALAIAVIFVDLLIKSRQRLKTGSKADQLRYGKGVKEEADRQNVFLGKCWQLPFCRKFVRERCPIYHSRRTCWRELTGCMCEEEVIRNAMENKPIPKDQLMATNYIPRNNKLTIDQKKERCKSCVIYNEHQRHKYKALLPTILIVFAAVYGLGHSFLIGFTSSVIATLDRLVGKATFRTGTSGNAVTQGSTFQELLLICLMVILLAYSMKVLEYVIFKLKV